MDIPLPETAAVNILQEVQIVALNKKHLAPHNSIQIVPQAKDNSVHGASTQFLDQSTQLPAEYRNDPLSRAPVQIESIDSVPHITIPTESTINPTAKKTATPFGFDVLSQIPTATLTPARTDTQTPKSSIIAELPGDASPPSSNENQDSHTQAPDEASSITQIIKPEDLPESSGNTSVPNPGTPSDSSANTSDDPQRLGPEANPAPTDTEEQPQEQPSEELLREIFSEFILNTLNQNAERYPWIVNQSDQLIFNPTTYQASPSYLNLNFDTKFSSSVRIDGQEFDNPILNKLQVSHFDKNRQFYWILNDNRVVLETQGGHADFGIQGRSTANSGNIIQQVLTQTQGLFGVQAVWALPTVISGLQGEENVAGLNTTTIAVEISNSNNIPINAITFDTGIDLNDPNVIFLDNLDFGETFSELGGGSLFENLSADNVPLFLQGFPTTNLQPLLDGGAELRVGQVITDNGFAQIQDRLGNARFSSLPGVYNLRPNTGSNEDLVRVLANPFLTQSERDFHYLNSLLWFDLGAREPEVELVEPPSGSIEGQGGGHVEDQDWSRLTTSFSRHRALLKYDAEKIKLNYSSIFANPGLSLTVSDFSDLDTNQTLHGTVGMLLGGLFYITPHNITTGLEDAQEKLEDLQRFGSLKTTATSQERRKMNVRLNATLSHASSTTALNQASGSWTFSSTTTPRHSRLFQLRTGLYRRGVLFISTDVEEGEFSPFGPATISNLRIANNDFGPLTFRGERVPIEITPLEDIQRTFAVQTTIHTPDGPIVASSGFPRRQESTTTVPLIAPPQPFDLTFDLIELTRSSTRNIRTSSDLYSGYLHLPATELLMAGTRGGLNYGITLGAWANFAPKSAPGVRNNQAGELNLNNFTEEPGLGFYLKATSNWVFQQIHLDEEKRVKSVVTHVPFITLNWNSAANRLNPNSVLAGYQFSWRNRELGLTLTPSLIYTPQSLNAITEATSQGQMTTNLSGRFFLQKGLDSRFNIELGNNAFFDTELTYKVIKNKKNGDLATGGYYSNYNTLNRGVSSRVSDHRFGLIFDYTLPNKDSSINLRIGTSETGFEASLQGNFKIAF